MIDHLSASAGFGKVVDDLYAGTLDDAAWDRALIGIADLVRASAALLLAFNPSSGDILREENHRFDSSVVDDYRRYWTYEDCRRVCFMSVPTGTPVTECTLPIPEWRSTPILNEFLLRVDAPHFMPAWLHKSDTKAVTLSLQGTRKRGPFDGRDLETFRQLLPHVTRALEIRDRLERAQVRADTLARHLDTLSFGVAVLDSAGKVLESNALVQEFLRSDCGVWRKIDGTLCLRNPAGRDLSRWILSGTPPAHGLDGLLHVPRPSAPPLSVMVTPLPALRTAWIGGDPRWLLVIFDPVRRVRASTELVARDLGISPAEAEVAVLLVAGYRLQEAALRLNVSKNTARTQLKSIFRKTGIRSQSELIRVIACGPAGHGP